MRADLTGSTLQLAPAHIQTLYNTHGFNCFLSGIRLIQQPWSCRMQHCTVSVVGSGASIEAVCVCLNRKAAAPVNAVVLICQWKCQEGLILTTGPRGPCAGVINALARK